jgi:hypothetical protein
MVAGQLIVLEESVDIALVGKALGKYTIVSSCDEKAVLEHTWRSRNNYANNDKIGKLHTLIMGPRPANVPEDWVIDHVNRNKLDNRRCNLRWVTPSFNAWNRDIFADVTYIGVRFHLGKWVARFQQKHCGCFDTEREAGRAVARAAIEAYGEWAETCDLITRNFTAEEIHAIKQDTIPSKPERELPPGVSRNGSKFVVCRDAKYQGTYDTVEAADAASKQYVKDKQDRKWKEHLKKEVTYDHEGHAVIALTGKNGEGKFAKVPPRFWHILTFKHPWNLWKCGYPGGRWEGTSHYLHYAVWKLLHPNYVPRKGFSIDHWVPGNPLDNREENLRILSVNGQQRNREKKSEGLYVGVHFVKSVGKWKGSVRVDGKTKQTRYTSCQHEAARLLNALRVKHFGKDAILNVILQ